MANTKQAKKRVRQAEKHRAHNASRRSMMRTYIKKTIAAIESGDVDNAKKLYIKMTSVLDTVAGDGLIHKNKAARHKSRLSQRIKSLSLSVAASV
ncbi:MAG: 30S ribosomal protein S20 [Gammaproteobacteria bacterium]|nr:30S ribosomal protein S20 [Gammaproteobacteria bacterium]